jgi:hypothetical protein
VRKAVKDQAMQASITVFLYLQSLPIHKKIKFVFGLFLNKLVNARKP